MLSIKPIGGSAGEVNYYAELGQEDYYTSCEQPPGVWWGEGAKALGEVGAVDKERFGALLRGFSPETQIPLVQNAGDPRRRSAFDLTFTVPKSVSVTWGLAESSLRRRIESAAELSVHRTLDVAGDYCGVSRRARHGERTDRAMLAAAVFRHDTARAVTGEAPDPNLHFHCVLLNVAVRPDGSTGALDARELFRPHMKMALGALFRAELATQLSHLGLESHRPLKEGKPVSWFELRDVPDELKRAFSKRRGQIEAWLEERGLSGAKAAERAASATRTGKSPWSREQLLEAWNATAQPFDFHPETIVHDSPNVSRPEPRERRNLALSTIGEITEHSSHFSEIEVLRRLAEASQTRGYRIDQIRADVASLLREDDKIVKLGEIRREARYSTPEMIAIERRMLRAAAASKGIWVPRLSQVELLKACNRVGYLRAEQRLAVEHLVGGVDQIACVNGMAGTGKTFMLGAAKKLWKMGSCDVIGTALAANAARGLEEGTGIPSHHIHSLLSQLDTQRVELNSSTILVVDEAGMVGTRTMDRLVQATVQAGSKLVLVGDYRQLQAIEAGGPFRALASELGAVELNEITRQKEAWARNAVRQFVRGDAGVALFDFLRRGQLTISQTRIGAMHSLVSEWANDFRGGGECLIFSGMRSETRLLNRFCQHELLSAKLIKDAFIEVDSERFHPGDRVVFTRNNNRILVRNGSGGRVAEVHPHTRTIVVDLDTGFRITVNVEAYPHLSLGYAVTVHKGQGRTVDSAFILAGGSMTDRELSYVQASRARGATRFYCDAESAGEDLTLLSRQMEKSRAKDLAVDHLMELQ